MSNDLQKDWDHWVVVCWQRNDKMGYIAIKFLERINQHTEFEDDVRPYHGAFAKLRGLGLERIPDDTHCFSPCGAWLATVCPTFLDAVIKAKKATNVDLSTLPFVANRKLARMQVNSTAGKRRDRAAASKSALVFHKEHHRGSENKLHGH